MNSLHNIFSANNNTALLAESLIRAARLQRLGSPKHVLEKEFQLIQKRASSVRSSYDRDQIPHKVEEALIRNISAAFGSTSCVNCASIYTCPIAQAAVNADAVEGMPPSPFPYCSDAHTLCPEYQPDWDQFAEAGKLFPDLVQRLERSFSLNISRKRIARHLVTIMGAWAKAVCGNSGRKGATI